MMRKSLILAALAFIAQMLGAQIIVTGAKFDLGSSTINVLRWNAETGALLDSVPTTSGGIAIGSSVFDAYDSKYYFSSGTGLQGVDFGSNTFAAYPGTQLSTSAEIDMANGSIYGVRQNLVFDSIGILVSKSMDMVKYDIANNIETVSGSFTGNLAAFLDASCFNSNLGIYYFVGTDSLLGRCLYAVNTRDSAFAFSLVPLNLTGTVIQTLEYDNENDILYALMHDISSSGNFHFLIQKIDPLTGGLTPEADFPQFATYQIGTCSFHQATSSMVFVFPDSSGPGLRIYNTITNTLTNGIMPISNIFEYECDNTEFAATKYNTTAATGQQAIRSLQISPNPTSGMLQIVAPTNFLQLQVIDAMGHVTALPVSSNMQKIDVSYLSPGYYTLRTQLANGSWTQDKFIKR